MLAVYQFLRQDAVRNRGGQTLRRGGLPDAPDPTDHVARAIAADIKPQEKDLLRRLVKKVLVHDKRTIEIWYALPNQASVRTLGHVAPHVDH